MYLIQFSTIIRLTIVIVGIWVCQPQTLNAQAVTGGPGQPEFTSFEPSVGRDIVDPLTGGFSYMVPELVHIPGPNGGYSMSLFYHDQITGSQVASWAGMGWNINAGAISRKVIGIPDDWRGEHKYIMGYEDLDTTTSHFLSLGFSIPGTEEALKASLTYSWGSHQTFNSGAGLSLGHGAGSFSLSTHGGIHSIGVGLRDKLGDGQYSTTPLGASYSFGNGGQSLSLAGIPLYSNFGSNRQRNIYIARLSYFRIPGFWYIPGYTYSKQKYYFMDYNRAKNYGALYSNEVYLDKPNDPMIQSWHKVGDSYSNPLGFESSSDPHEYGSNISGIAKDQFIVSAEGLAGHFSANLYEEGNIPRLGTTYNQSTGERIDYVSKDPISLTPDKIQFAFDGAVFSAPDMPEGDWAVNPSQSGYQDPISNVSRQNNSSSNPATYFDPTTNQAGSPNVIKWYSNEEIHTAYTSSSTNFLVKQEGFMEYEDITANRITNKDGLGGFMITAANGYTYHFALPVYQFEQFASNEGESGFFANFQLAPYATHWLITGITGPDFVDFGGPNNEANGLIDDSDFGYWVKFSYGKWSDSYLWRIPYEGFLEGTDPNPTNGEFAQGRKQVYYLNSVETKTHKAVFVKGLRDDAKGASSVGLDYTATSQNNSIKFVTKNSCSMCPSGYTVTADLEYSVDYNNMEDHHSLLKLEDILIFRKEDLSIDASSIPSNFPSASSTGEFALTQDTLDWYIAGATAPCCGGRLSTTSYTNIEANLGQNVIDQSDVPINASEHLLSKVQLSYDYSLAQNTPNSDATDGTTGSGRLTLNKVKVFGTHEADVIPTYQFSYQNHGDYDPSAMDDWGFYTAPGTQDENWYLRDLVAKPNIDNWHLKEVLLPEGGKLAITQEAREYDKEALFGKVADIPIHTIFKNSIAPVFNNPNDATPAYLQASLNQSEYQLISPHFPVGHNTSMTLTIECDYQGNTAQADYSLDVSVSNLDPVNNKIDFSFIPGSYIGDAICQIIGIEMEESYISQPIATGGGVRVKKIEFEDANGQTYGTQYDYSGGVTTYRLGNPDEMIPLAYEIMGPGVIYETVGMEEIGDDQISAGRMVYTFDVPDDRTTNLSGNTVFQMGNEFELEDLQNGANGNNYYHGNLNTVADGQEDHIYIRTSVIHDRLSQVGRILKEESISPQGVTIGQTVYNYKTIANHDLSTVGTTQKTYTDAKRILTPSQGGGVPFANWFFTTSSKIQYPNILESIISRSGGIEKTTVFEDHDPFTGEPRSVRNISANGQQTKSTKVFLHESALEMGSKVENSTNQNQLVQVGSSSTSISLDDGNTWKPVAAAGNIWKNNWEILLPDGAIFSVPESDHIWLPWKSYSWKGFLNEDGSYGSAYQPFDPANPDVNGWKLTSEATLYDYNFSSIEAKDINDRKAATHFGYGIYHRPIASANNSNLAEFFFSGAEDWDATNNWFGGFVSKGDATIYEYTGDLYNINDDWDVSNNAHTGRFSLEVSSSNPKGFNITTDIRDPNLEPDEFGPRNDATYRLSVWVRNQKGNGVVSGIELYAQSVGGTNSLQTMSSSGNDLLTADGWQLVNFDVDMSQFSGTQAVELGVRHLGGSPIFVDDFRFHRVDVAMTSIVYDPITGEVIASLDNDNIASLIRTEEEKREVWTYQESKDGIKKVSKQEYNFSRKD